MKGCRNYFMTNLHQIMLPGRRIEPAYQAEAHPTELICPVHRMIQKKERKKETKKKWVKKKYEITKDHKYNHTNAHIYENIDYVGVTIKRTHSGGKLRWRWNFKIAPCQVVAFDRDDPSACYYLLKVSKGLHIASWKESDSWGTTLKRQWNHGGLLLQFSNCTKLLTVV